MRSPAPPPCDTLHGFLVVLRHTLPLVIHHTQIVLRPCVALCGKRTPEFHRLSIITTVIRREPIFKRICCRACRTRDNQEDREEDTPHRSSTFQQCHQHREPERHTLS